MDGRKERDMIRKSYGEGVVKYNVSAMIIFLVGTTKETNSKSKHSFRRRPLYPGTFYKKTLSIATIISPLNSLWASNGHPHSAAIVST